MGQQAEKRQDKKNNGGTQKTKIGDNKGESNDSHEISDGGGGGRDIRHPWPPFRVCVEATVERFLI